MKKITFLLSLVSLSLTVTSASAAVQTESETAVRLPTYRVEAPRYTAAEKSIEAGLTELRAQARSDRRVRTELPSLGTVAQAERAPEGRAIAAQARVLPGRS